MFSFFKTREADGEDRQKRSHVWLLLLAGAVGILLLLFGNQTAKEAETDPQAELYDPKKDELVLYQDYLEKRVTALCEQVAGVGDVTAIVTLAGGFEDVYATENVDGGEEYVILGNGSNASALFLSRSAPQIAGIGVVCRGGSNAGVVRELTALLSASFRIPSNRIYITESGG